VTRVVPRARLHDEAAAVAAKLASLPSAALAAAKEAMVRGADMPLEQALRLESEIARRLARESQ
jgi:enoyl-CoA hydratase/carnithine racemase